MSVKPVTVSPARLAANRANAAHSTGPRTTAGKARSSRNALKHGLLAKQILYFSDPRIQHADADKLGPDESYEDLMHLLDQLLADHEPATALEQTLVERIAAACWRLRRAYRYETLSIVLANIGDEGDDSLRFNLLPEPQDLDNLLRYEAAIQRELYRCLNQLITLRRLRCNAAANSISSDNLTPPVPPDSILDENAKIQNEPTADRPATPAHGLIPSPTTSGNAVEPVSHLGTHAPARCTARTPQWSEATPHPP